MKGYKINDNVIIRYSDNRVLKLNNTHPTTYVPDEVFERLDMEVLDNVECFDHCLFDILRDFHLVSEQDRGKPLTVYNVPLKEPMYIGNFYGNGVGDYHYVTNLPDGQYLMKSVICAGNYRGVYCQDGVINVPNECNKCGEDYIILPVNILAGFKLEETWW